MGGVVLSNKAVLRRLKRLEKVFAVGHEDRWLDIVMWDHLHGGIFGHAHCLIRLGGGETRAPSS